MIPNLSGSAANQAVKEYQTNVGTADYVLFIDKKPVGIIEAKKADDGYKLNVVAEQSATYASAKLKYLDNDPLPFVYESTGTVTNFTDYRDNKARARAVFSFHKPTTLADWKQFPLKNIIYLSVGLCLHPDHPN